MDRKAPGLQSRRRRAEFLLDRRSGRFEQSSPRPLRSGVFQLLDDEGSVREGARRGSDDTVGELLGADQHRAGTCCGAVWWLVAVYAATGAGLCRGGCGIILSNWMLGVLPPLAALRRRLI